MTNEPPLFLEQTFPLGRFHATRWNQNPFEDRYGEWPPSPWRLLRTIAARWFQYSRETGDDDERKRDELLLRLASSPLAYHLPDMTWRGQPLRQYQPTEVAWTDASKKAAAYRKPKTTLVVDHYRVVPPSDPIYWFFDLPDGGGICEALRLLLEAVLDRTCYFGRAESWTRFRVLASVPEPIVRNCTLQPIGGEGDSPVLVPDPSVPLDVSTLLAVSDDRLLAGRTIPPGTRWWYAKIPDRPRLLAGLPTADRKRFPSNLRVVQFGVGGRVFPPLGQWIRVTERFRGRVLRIGAQKLSGRTDARYEDLDRLKREKLQLMSGKDAQGNPLPGHRHTYFVLWPDDYGQPTRLVCLRRDSPYTQEEIETLLRASERPYSWEYGNPDWSLRLVPLPFDTPEPSGASAASTTWISKTPFVLPGKRHRFRQKGRERRGEFPDEILRKLLVKHGFPQPLQVVALATDGSVVHPGSLSEWSKHHEWLSIHETSKERSARRTERTRAVRPGYRFRIEFPQPVAGPICLGHSCHFGLGLFVRAKVEG